MTTGTNPMATATSAGNAGLCPLCGRPNACQLCTTTATKGPCWCYQVEMPAELLARVPDAYRNLACICRECVTDFHAKRKP